jgi:L,D-transpeptidase YbiS
VIPKAVSKGFVLFFCPVRIPPKTSGWTGVVRSPNGHLQPDRTALHTLNMPAKIRFRLPSQLRVTLARRGVRASRHVLIVSVQRQRMFWLLQINNSQYIIYKSFIASTSRFGTGQLANSNRTPIGLHEVASKAGAGLPVGTVFQGRKPAGLTWQGRPEAPIAHRILWLSGLEPGFNQGGNLDSYQRYIYIHGVGDETTLGRPASRGCIHLGSSDLMFLFDRLPLQSLVWITAGPIGSPSTVRSQW